MTSTVQITLSNQRMPMLAELLHADGTVVMVTLLNNMSCVALESLDDGKTLRIREMTADEIQDAGPMYSAAHVQAILAEERERWAAKCTEAAANLRRDPSEKKQISAQMADWLAGELRANTQHTAR